MTTKISLKSIKTHNLFVNSNKKTLSRIRNFLSLDYSINIQRTITIKLEKTEFHIECPQSDGMEDCIINVCVSFLYLYKKKVPVTIIDSIMKFILPWYYILKLSSNLIHYKYNLEWDNKCRRLTYFEMYPDDSDSDNYRYDSDDDNYHYELSRDEIGDLLNYNSMFRH